MKNILLIFFTLLLMESTAQRIFLESDSIAPFLGIKCEKMKALKDTSYTEYGIESSFKRFEIQSKIQVQIECNGTEAKLDSAIAKYEVAIALNNNDSFGNAMVDSIYNQWSKKSIGLPGLFYILLY